MYERTFLEQVGYFFSSNWGLIWPEYILPMFMLAILLNLFWRALRVRSKGKAAFVKGNLGNEVIKVVATTAALFILMVIVLTSVEYLGHEDVTQHRPLWKGQVERFPTMLAGVFLGTDDEVVKTDSNVLDQTATSPASTVGSEQITPDTVISRTFDGVPVLISNLPYLVSGKTDPREVKVEIRGHSRQIQELSAGDLSVMVDYNRWNAKDKIPCQFIERRGIKFLSVSPSAVNLVVDTSLTNQIKLEYKANPSAWHWDLIFVVIFLLFFTPTIKSLSVWRWNKSLGWVITVLYLLLYLTLRSWLNDSYSSGLWVVVDLIQLIVVGAVAIFAYRYLRQMLDRGQCAITLDPISKQSIDYKDPFFFRLEMMTYVVFLLGLSALILFSWDIMKIGGSLSVRLLLLAFTLAVTGLAWWLVRMKRPTEIFEQLKAKGLNINLGSWQVPITGLILGALALIWPGVWLFVMVLFVMVLSWVLGSLMQIPIAHKMIIVLFNKDRYHWLMTLGTCKNSILLSGINIMILPVWFPGLKFYVFQREILEIDKFKIEDDLPTSSIPCEFEQVGDRWVEKRLDDSSKRQVGPPVAYFVNIRLRMFEDPHLFLRLSDEDRTNYQALAKRVVQNMLGRLTRRLSLNQALTMGYAVSEHHYFHLEGFEAIGKDGITFKGALNKELMDSIGFSLMSLEISDANPPSDLQKSQIEVEQARYALEKQKLVSEARIIEIAAEGKGLADKIAAIQKAMANAQSTADWLAVMELAKNAGTIIVPSSFVDKVSGLMQVAQKIAGSGS